MSSRPIPSTPILEETLHIKDRELRDALSYVNEICASTDEIQIKHLIATLKQSSDQYAQAIRSLADRKREIENESDALSSERFTLIQDDSYEAIARLNARLLNLGFEPCSSVKAFSVSREVTDTRVNSPKAVAKGYIYDYSVAPFYRNAVALSNGCIEEKRLVCALENLPNILESSNIAEIESHICEVNDSADLIVKIVKPVISQCVSYGLNDDAARLRKRYNPLVGSKVDDAISQLEARIKSLERNPESQSELNIQKLVNSLEDLISDAQSARFYNNVKQIEEVISKIGNASRSALDAVAALKDSYIKAGRNVEAHQLDRRHHPLLVDSCARTIRTLNTRVTYLQRSISHGDSCNPAKHEPALISTVNDSPSNPSRAAPNAIYRPPAVRAAMATTGQPNASDKTGSPRSTCPVPALRSGVTHESPSQLSSVSPVATSDSAGSNLVDLNSAGISVPINRKIVALCNKSPALEPSEPPTNSESFTLNPSDMQIKDLLEPPDHVLTKNFDAGNNLRESCINEINERHEAQMITSDLLSGENGSLKLLRRVSVK